MNSNLIFIVLELGAQTHTHLCKIIVIQHHKLIINKNNLNIATIMVNPASLTVVDWALIKKNHLKKL